MVRVVFEFGEGLAGGLFSEVLSKIYNMFTTTRMKSKKYTDIHLPKVQDEKAESYELTSLNVFFDFARSCMPYIPFREQKKHIP